VLRLVSLELLELGVVLEMLELRSLERDVSVELELGLLALVLSASPPGELEVVEPVVLDDPVVSVAVELLELGLLLDELGVDDAVLLLKLGLELLLEGLDELVSVELLGVVLELLLPYVDPEPVCPAVEFRPVEAVLP